MPLLRRNRNLLTRHAYACSAEGEPVVQLKDGTAPTNHYALTKVFSETIGEMYARGVQPRFPEAGQPTDNQMSVVITRLGWFIRNTGESETLVAAKAYGAYLSHDDACRYFVRVVESPTPVAGESAVCYAQSATPSGFPEPHDNTSAREVLGYEGQDVYPAGIPFKGARPYPEEILKEQAKL